MWRRGSGGNVYNQTNILYSWLLNPSTGISEGRWRRGGEASYIKSRYFIYLEETVLGGNRFTPGSHFYFILVYGC